MVRIVLLCFIPFTIWLYTGSLCPSAAQSTRYVKPVAQGAGDGSSWANASSDLKTMINDVSSSGGIVLVTGGLYKPLVPAGRYGTFSMASGVGVYGGCGGTESTPKDRVLTVPSSTTLSGDIGSPNSTTDNSYHVVTFSNATRQTRLDGVVITAGASGGAGSIFPKYVGGGIYNSSSGVSSTPVIANCHIVNNSATDGGGLYNYANPYVSNSEASPVLINCSFIGNLARADGGALYNDGVGASQVSSPILNGCHFVQNTANGLGGAIMNVGKQQGNSSPTIRSSSFTLNQAGTGGAIANFGGGGTSSPLVISCMFSQNTATRSYGGAVYNDGSYSGRSNPQFLNCTFSKNTAADYYQGFGGGMYSVGSYGTSQPQLTNCIFWGNTSSHFLDGNKYPSIESMQAPPSIINSAIEGLARITPCMSCSGNIDTNPLFANANSHDLQLQASSPLIDKGIRNDLVYELSPDIAGKPRVSGCQIDLGAYEYQSPFGADLYTLTTGSWDDPAIWSCGRLPTYSDNVIIRPAHRVLLTSTMTEAVCLNLEILGTFSMQGSSIVINGNRIVIDQDNVLTK